MPAPRSASLLVLAALLAATALPGPASAEGPDLLEFAKPVKGPGGGGGGGTRTPSFQPWMHPEVELGWDLGALGRGVTITVVDDFSSRNRYLGNLGDGLQRLRHGEWTLKEAGMIAPSATMATHDFYTGRAVSLAPGFDVLNLSYGMVDVAGFDTVVWDPQETSIIAAARDGTAVVSKAAGNDYGTAVGEANASGIVDYLGRDLIGTQGTLFVGALDGNGSTSDPAARAGYSNIAGDSATVQGQFLVVGVESGMTNLAGTSFAAPIVAGYAAMLQSKFNAATPAAVADRLLDTARDDTIAGYSLREHGQGEASILNALAPNWLQ